MSPPKPELNLLADRLLLREPEAIAACVDFVLGESKGLWHGRGRAKMSRRLKHCPLSMEQRRLLIDCIAARLERGDFSEQFRDQLRLAISIGRDRMIGAARAILARPAKDHVRRYAQWILDRQPQ